MNTDKGPEPWRERRSSSRAYMHLWVSVIPVRAGTRDEEGAFLRKAPNRAALRQPPLGSFDQRSGLLDAAFHQLSLEFKFLSGKKIDFCFKRPIARQRNLDPMLSGAD